MMKIAENVNVYWSSLHETVEFDNLYNLFNEHYQNISSTNRRQNLLLCPAVSHKLKNTFFIKTPVDCEYSIKDNNIVPSTKDFIATEIPHQPLRKVQHQNALQAVQKQKSVPLKQLQKNKRHAALSFVTFFTI